MKKHFFFFLFLSFSLSFSQQGSNIDLEEVVNTAGVIPRIYLNGTGYSFRERDTLVKSLLRSAFWKTFTFKINLEDYETGKLYSFDSDGPLIVSINDVELTKDHVFKSFTSIRQLTKKIESVEIRTDKEVKNIVTSVEEGPPIIIAGGGMTSVVPGQKIYNRKEVPVTQIKIRADLVTNTLYNRKSYSRRIREIESDQASSIALEGVDVVEKVGDDGTVYSPVYVDGQLTFQKDEKLTELKRLAKRYEGMGLNEWGIDVSTDSWGVALRAHYKGPMDPEGLPIIVPAMSINNKSTALWVLDGTPLTEPPPSVRSLTPFIREVKILKYSESSFYGARGAAGVIVINTRVGMSSDGRNAKRSFNVKGKKNRELLAVFQKMESQFKLKLEQLKTQKKYAYENDNVIRMDSFQRLLDKTLLKSYLYTANFAITNSDYEIAPYLAFTKISDANISLLDSIAKKLSPKVKNSRYGKKFISFLVTRRDKQLNNPK